MDRSKGHVQDIIDAIVLIKEHTDALTSRDFIDEKNVLIQNLAMRQLGIIGEATKKLSKNIYDSNPDIPWHEIAGMRNRLIHEYDNVDLYVVWQTITESLPALAKALQEYV